MEDLLHFLFDLVTLKSRKRGPLVASAAVQGESLCITVENQGPRQLEFAAVRARDARGVDGYPPPDLAPRTPIPAGDRVTLRLDVAELRAQGCVGLEVLDTSGKAWPVADVAAALRDG